MSGTNMCVFACVSSVAYYLELPCFRLIKLNRIEQTLAEGIRSISRENRESEALSEQFGNDI